MADTNPKQELFLAHLFDRDSETQGDSMASCLAAGYDRRSHSSLIKILREELRNRTIDAISSLAARSVMQLERSMDEDGKTPRAEIRLKAAESILDRMGAGKQQIIDITSKDEQISPLFILPPKNDDIIVSDEYDNVDIHRD